MKAKIIEQIQQRLPGRTSKEQADQALKAVLESIQHVAKNNEGGAQIVGFGTFVVTTQAGRAVKPIGGGEIVHTSDKQVLKFRASKALVL